MTLYDSQILAIVDALLKHEGIPHDTERFQRLRDRSAGAASVRALGDVVDRYLAIANPPRMCQVEHAHWEGPMICGNTLPCPRHGGR